MTPDGNRKRSVIPRLNMSRLKRHNESKSGSPTKGMTNLVKNTSQETAKTSRRDASPPSSKYRSEAREPLIRRRSRTDPDMSPIFLGIDFGALLHIRGGISSQENLWIDMWQHFAPGKTVVPLDDQYLSCLNSFMNLRCLMVSGMLKSYQKRLFQAIWKMEHLEDLQLRMAEEPRISPKAVLPWRPIEKGWRPQAKEPEAYIKPGDGKGRILKEYGDAEYLDNCAIELAKPNLKGSHPEYDSWMSRLLPIVHLTLRGFVVDAVPFCSCFNGDKLRSITFTDCYDAGFYLPNDMEEVELRVFPVEKKIAKEGRRVSLDQEAKCLILKDKKKVSESPFSSSPSHDATSSYYPKPGASSSIPRYAACPSPTPSSHSSSSPVLRKPRFSLGFRKRPVSSVIEEDEEEE
ncbi:conserved hypothetical protein [Talaromyces marneffei ATCC 18224]|uniref:Uncharacterized protein n=1 Tax=Talaromyces marneffei (strain ATCC 18224 / CBS 334.59 / QM 7333) TaxID=441960 RepID=B6Q7V4_TALMQ|nr:conserved hypothetical protein [Talaromyces marneffei ATCC 18224]